MIYDLYRNLFVPYKGVRALFILFKANFKKKKKKIRGRK